MLLSSNTASNKDINSSTASCCFAHQTKWKQKLRLHKSFAEMTSHLSYSKTQAAEYKKNYNYLGSENGILNETASCWLGVQSIWIWPACITGENRWLGKRFLLGESCNAALGLKVRESTSEKDNTAWQPLCLIRSWGTCSTNMGVFSKQIL